MTVTRKASCSIGLLAWCAWAVSADTPPVSREPFPLPLRSDEVAATAASPGAKYLVIVLRDEHSEPLSKEFPIVPPMGVWQVPIKGSRPVFADAVRVGRMPRVYACKDGLRVCLRDDVLYGVYATSLESGTYLTFCAVPMTGSWVPEDLVFSYTVVATVDGKEGRFDVMKNNVPAPEHIRFRYAPEFRGQKVVTPKPVAIFFDLEGGLCVLGNDEDEQRGLFLIRSEDKGRTWNDAVPCSGPARTGGHNGAVDLPG